MSPTLWRCGECDSIVKNDDLLQAQNPFGGGGKVIGCPRCKEVPTFSPVCDEPGCRDIATCGFPGPLGYRRTCGAHYRLKV